MSEDKQQELEQAVEPTEEPETATPTNGGEPEEAPPDSIDEAAVDDMATQIEAVTVERDKLRSELEELQARMLRRQADFENFRKRVENERADFAKFAGMETVRELLPILDDFERAVQAAPAADGAEGEFIKGVEMIYQRLVDALKKAGLEPITSVGQPFDPNFHHAVETVESEEMDDHTVLQEWQRGYNFKGKLLREAMVKVSVKPTAETSETTDSK